jgi:hypothetical protein
VLPYEIGKEVLIHFFRSLKPEMMERDIQATYVRIALLAFEPGNM